MAEDPSVGHRGYITLHDVQIRAADGGGVDAHDRVGAINDHRVGHSFPRLLAGTVIHESLHWVTSSSSCGSRSPYDHCGPTEIKDPGSKVICKTATWP